MDKERKVLILAWALISIMAGCGLDSEDDDTIGNWVKVSDFEGVTRSGTVSFTIGDYAYVGLGFDGDDYLTDFWRYDPGLNFWQRVDSFPGIGRIGAVAFSLNGKGYIGTGFNQDLDEEELDDFWEYDPQTDAWTERAAFAGGPRHSAVAFSLNNKGYIGTGYDGNYLKDIWRYDATSDSWEQTVSLFGSKREQAFSFTIDGKAYVGGGRNNGAFLDDFWAFDPESQVWEDLSIDDEEDHYDEYILAMSRHSASGLASLGLGYVIGGISNEFTRTVYRFDPNSRSWDDLTAFEGTARSDAAAFVINDRIFLGTGRNSNRRFDDFFEFNPMEEYDEDD